MRKHREVSITVAVRHAGIVFLENRRDLATCQVDPVERPASSRRPESPAPVVGEIGLTTPELRSGSHAFGATLVSREGGRACDGMFECAVDEPTPSSRPFSNQQKTLAGLHHEQPCAAVARDVDQLVGSTPHDGTILKVAPGLRHQYSVRRAVGRDQMKRTAGAAFGILAMAAHHTQVGNPAAIR